jgi:muramidase (phage lysozyme)
MQANERAFLDMLAVSEGTYGHGDNGYNVLVGGDLFQGYAKHPNVLVTLNKAGLKSTAAGRYQFLKRTWNSLATKLHLADFSPAAQDVAALELIAERGAADDVRSGRFAEAVAKCAPVWASLPGAGYGQRENSLKALEAAYIRAGGQLA